MKISEVPFTPSSAPSTTTTISNLETLISQLESLTPILQTNHESSTISTLISLSNCIPSSISQLPSSNNLHLWKLSFRLWNSCVDLHNTFLLLSHSSSCVAVEEAHAKLRHASAELLLVGGRPVGIPSPEFKAAVFFHKTGLLWHGLKRFDLASGCFEKATDLVAGVELDRIKDSEERILVLELNLARGRTAWEVKDWNLAIAMLNRSRNLMFGLPACYKTLAEQYLDFGKLVLGRNHGSDTGGSADLAISPSKLLSEALDLCEKGMRVCKVSEDRAGLESLKCRVLRFLAAERLQAEDYEGALRCVGVLREAEKKGEKEHASVGFVALKAWVGMRRVAEAEKELKAMVVNKGVPESVCVSAAEVFLAAAGAEAAKGVLMGLVGRCRLGAAAALRVVQSITVAGGGSGRARVVAELVSDERVVGIFSGEEGKKERSDMHALLWNYATEHFQSKDFEMAAELFEKSMLYIKHDEENRPRRANCYRVLCLCHLGLSQLDRAQEFIDEAEKLQPTVNCAFLKFKVYLQKGAEKEAINQIEAILRCVDFNPEYLTLSVHEAMASKCTLVAIESLSILMSLYSPGKVMPIPEVVVLRSIIQLLQKSHDGNDLEILKYIKRGWTRMTELGAESFFGKGVIGSRELNWFAAHAWNMGLKTAKERRYESCVGFLEMAAEFYSVVQEETAENSAMICKALILTVAAIIASEEHREAALQDADIKKAMEMLDKASKILASSAIASSAVILDGNQPLIEPGLLFLHTFNAYQILGRLSEDPSSKQLQLIKSFVSSSSKSCTPQNLLQLGLVALHAPRPNIEVTNFVFNTCLSEHLASPSPDYHAVSLIVRKLVGLTVLRREKGVGSSHDGTYEVYRQAYRILVGLKNDEYPKEEGKWLAMTAWNRSAVAVRMGQQDVAIKWMRMGLDLAKHVTGMESYIAGMEECLANIEKISSGESSSRIEEDSAV